MLLLWLVASSGILRMRLCLECGPLGILSRWKAAVPPEDPCLARWFGEAAFFPASNRIPSERVMERGCLL